ncbi:uncharacterized [Tachysurus ichikawai]
MQEHRTPSLHSALMRTGDIMCPVQHVALHRAAM